MPNPITPEALQEAGFVLRRHCEFTFDIELPGTVAGTSMDVTVWHDGRDVSVIVGRQLIYSRHWKYMSDLTDLIRVLKGTDHEL